MRVVFLAAILMISGCSESDPPPDPSALVALAPVELGAINQTVTLYGAAESNVSGQQALVAPVGAIVSNIAAPVGSVVAKGQLVAQLAPAPNTQLDLAKAVSDARAADAAFERTKRLRTDGLLGDAEVETARAAAESADATRENLLKRSDALALRAPYAGYVVEVAASIGDQVQAGAPVVKIARPRDLRAQFGADPETARLLRPGMPVRIRSSAGKTTLSAPIQSIDPVVDPQTRLASVFTSLPATATLAIGETLIGEVTINTKQNTLIIPYAALLDDGGQPYVFVVADGVAHRHDITIGFVNDDRVAVSKGVRQGDQVVTEGGGAVDDGMKVRTQ